MSAAAQAVRTIRMFMTTPPVKSDAGWASSGARRQKNSKAKSIVVRAASAPVVFRPLHHHLPTASATHLVVKLAFAAPANFRSAADASHDVCASLWHLVMKLVSAAPASRFSAA